MPFQLLKGTKVDESQTQILDKYKHLDTILNHALDAIYYGNTLIEFTQDNNKEWVPTLIPRQHVIHQIGLFVKQVSDTSGISYRLLPQYGHTLIEATNNDHLGILNKAVPHVIYKRFAQSCYSEFCEIFGMPPRIGKTNTQDPVMLRRMETMFREMGSAPYAVLDSSETLEWGQASNGKGEVYQGLIAICNQEIGVLISGGGSNLQAIINACKKGTIKARLALVVSDKPEGGQRTYRITDEAVSPC